jgi:alkylhydroperoxidase family enzyme
MATRLRQVPRSELTSPVVTSMYQRLFGDRDPVTHPGTATGTPGNWWSVFANSPDVLEHAGRGFGLYASPERKVPGELRELGQTRAGWLVGSQFVFSQHCKSCRSLGMSEEKIAAIPSWGVAECFSPIERAVLAYTDCLVLDGGRVPDGVFAALQAELSDEEILELTYITVMYEMHAVIARALRLEYDDRPEPIVEVAAPGGAGARDIGADISAPEPEPGGAR